MNEKTYLRDALEAHEKGDKSRASALLIDGLNHSFTSNLELILS